MSTILITGGSRGLGRNMALASAKKGHDIIITYHSNKAAADEVVQAIAHMGRKAAAFQLNTGNTKEFDAFLAEVAAYQTKVTGQANFDYLVNNAGVGYYAGVQEVSEEQMDMIYTIHYKGVYMLTQKSLAYLNDGGGIVNVSSGLTRMTLPGSSVYGSLKAAVETFSRYMAKELGSRKIRVNVIAPGAIETDFGGGRVRDNKELNAQIAGYTSLGRVGLPDDIGGVVAFLCSTEASWITGQRIEVSGGQNL